MARPPKRHAGEQPQDTPNKRSKTTDTAARKDRHEGTRKKTREPVDNVLLDDIRALGGDEDDLELIGMAGLDSGSEQLGGTGGSDHDQDPSLDNELAAFAAGLGLDVKQLRSPAQKQKAPKKEESTKAEAKPGKTAEKKTSKVDKEEKKAVKVDKKPEKKRDAGDMLAPQQSTPKSRPVKAKRDPTTAEAEPDAPVTVTPRVKEAGSREKKLVFTPRSDWHETSVAQASAAVVTCPPAFAAAIEALKHHAQSVLDADVEHYGTSRSSSSSKRFLSTIITSGTLQDKVSALTLAIQESPLHNVKAFQSLFALASKRSRTQAAGALGALVDLLGPGSLLPPSRRLRAFSAQPALLAALRNAAIIHWKEGDDLPRPLTDTDLVYWLYEDWLKEAFFKVVMLLETWTSDEIEFSRMNGIDFVYALLKEKPEQEANLLRLLIDKLGDRERRVSSRASFLLLQLQVLHPRMKRVIVDTIDKELLLDPARGTRARYCAINTLNQTILSSREPDLVTRLLDIYFKLFSDLLEDRKADGPDQDGRPAAAKPLNGGPKGSASRPPQKRHPRKIKPAPASASDNQGPETDEKLVSAILTGINRAVPFASVVESGLHLHVDTLFRVVHGTNMNTSLQALLLIQKLSSVVPTITDRFYRVLYETLLDPRLATSSKQAMYLNLLLRAIKADHDLRRVKAFAKRMLQITTNHQVAFACGILYVVSQARQTFPNLGTLIEQPEDHSSSGDASSNNDVYDGRKRSPEYSNAHRSCLWELGPLLSHFHPAVAKAADCLYAGTEPVSRPDLEHHSLMRFLDKFAFKAPKTSQQSRGVSIMQPYHASESQTGEGWLGAAAVLPADSNVNTAMFRQRDVADVAVEDVFFHRYFAQIPRTSGAGDKSDRDNVDTVGSDGGDEDEDEIWKALVSTQHEDDRGEEELDDSDMDVEDLGNLLSDDDDDDDQDMVEDGDVDVAMGSDEDGDKDGNEDGDFFGLPATTPASQPGEPGELDKSKRNKVTRDRRKALRGLPTFASAEDYEALLAGNE